MSAVTTTPRASQSGLGLAHSSWMLVLCAGLACCLPTPPPEPPGVFDETSAFACGAPGDSSAGHEWTTRAIEVDPQDSDDNDDDDGSDGPDAAISVGRLRVPILGDTSSLHIEVAVRFSIPPDGHYLRGPPPNLQNPDEFDVDDDDDERFAPNLTLSQRLADPCRTWLRSLFHVDPPLPLTSCGRALRAPPDGRT